MGATHKEMQHLTGSISEILRRVMKVKYMIAIIIINTKGKRKSLRIIIILIIIIFD